MSFLACSEVEKFFALFSYSRSFCHFFLYYLCKNNALGNAFYASTKTSLKWKMLLRENKIFFLFKTASA